MQKQRNWKKIAATFIILFIVETILFVSLFIIGTIAVNYDDKQEMKCAYDICELDTKTTYDAYA